MKRFWLSWYEKSEDYRPVKYPPNEQIAGWWCSGTRCADEAATICALVDAKTEKDAWKAVRKDWPQKSFEVRFCEEKPSDYLPGDRFVTTEKWSNDRLKQFIQPKDTTSDDLKKEKGV